MLILNGKPSDQGEREDFPAHEDPITGEPTKMKEFSYV